MQDLINPKTLGGGKHIPWGRVEQWVLGIPCRSMQEHSRWHRKVILYSMSAGIQHVQYINPGLIGNPKHSSHASTIQKGTAKQPRKEQHNNRESKHCNWRRIWKCSTDLNIQIECENQCKDCHCFIVVAPSYWPGDVWWNLHQTLYFR